MTAAVAADVDPQANKTAPLGLADPVNRILVVRMLAKGHSRRAAAEMVGCHVATIGRTAARDPAFRHALVQAEQNVTMQALQHVTAAASEPRYWRAGAWILERTEPERFGRKPSPPLGPEDVSEMAQGITEAIQPMGFSDEQLDQVQTRIEEFLTEVVASHQAGAPAKRGQGRAKSAGSQPPRQPTPPARNTPPTAGEKQPATQPVSHKPVTSPNPTAAQRATPPQGVARQASDKPSGKPSNQRQDNGPKGHPLPWGLEDLTTPMSDELIGSDPHLAASKAARQS